MTDQELKDLVASLAVEHAKTELSLQELSKNQKETDRLVKEIACQQKETDCLVKEIARQQKETDLQLKETDRQQKETDRQLRAQMKELSKQIGGLGNKFGSFTEGMAFPSMEKVLRKKLGMTTIVQRARSTKNGKEVEIDILAYTNTDKNIAYIVEVKSHLKERDLEQVLNIMQQFPIAFPEHKDKAIYGILAIVDGSSEMKKKVIEAGLYLAVIHDEQFTLKVPKGFKPKNFQCVTWEK